MVKSLSQLIAVNYSWYMILSQLATFVHTLQLTDIHFLSGYTNFPSYDRNPNPLPRGNNSTLDNVEEPIEDSSSMWCSIKLLTIQISWSKSCDHIAIVILHRLSQCQIFIMIIVQSILVLSPIYNVYFRVLNSKSHCTSSQLLFWNKYCGKVACFRSIFKSHNFPCQSLLAIKYYCTLLQLSMWQSQYKSFLLIIT